MSIDSYAMLYQRWQTQAEELDALRTLCGAAETASADWEHAAGLWEHRALAAERSRDEARAEVEAWRAKSDALAKHYESEICQLQALEMNHEGACVRLKAERDEAREALRPLMKSAEIAAGIALRNCVEDKGGPPACQVCRVAADTVMQDIARAARVLSGEKEGAPTERTEEDRRVESALHLGEAHGYEEGVSAGVLRGAEWMREQAARAVESTEEYSFSVAVKMAPSDHLACAVARIRSLPTSPPAPAEQPERSEEV